MRAALSFLILLLSTRLFGQVVNDSIEKHLIITGGASYQGEGNYFGELGIMLSRPYIGLASKHDGGPRFSTEFSISAKNFVIAPKLGYELSELLTFRLNLISYLDHQNIDLRFLPEIGVGYFPYFTLTYGYNLPLLSFETEATTRHRVSLSFNLYRFKWY